jgi:hypothetical protein
MAILAKVTLLCNIIFNIIKIHGTTIKIIDAQQAKLRNSHKNTKLRLLKLKCNFSKNRHRLPEDGPDGPKRVGANA